MTRIIDISSEAVVLASLQTLIDRVVTAPNLRSVLESPYNNPFTDYLYWDDEQPPLATASIGCTRDNNRIGIHLRILARARQEDGNVAKSDEFVEQLELRLGDTNAGVRFMRDDCYGPHAHLAVSPDILRVAGVVVKIVRSR